MNETQRALAEAEEVYKRKIVALMEERDGLRNEIGRLEERERARLEDAREDFQDAVDEIFGRPKPRDYIRRLGLFETFWIDYIAFRGGVILIILPLALVVAVTVAPVRWLLGKLRRPKPPSLSLPS